MVDLIQAKEKILSHNIENPYVDITPFILDVGFPIVNYIGFFPAPDEIIIYAVPASSFKDKEQVVGYTGKSAGVSVRVAKGVTLRSGGSGGRAIRDTVRKHYSGDLIITNKRIIFISKDENFEFSVDKISAVKPLSTETFVIHAGRSSRNICVESAVITYTIALINHSINAYSQGIDLKLTITQANNEMTREQKELCTTVKQEVDSMPPPKSKKNKKKKGCLFHFLLGILFFLLLVLGILIFAECSSNNNKTNIEIYNYTDTEIIYKEGHPVINDSFETAKDFYADVDKNKVKVLSRSEHASIQRKLKTNTSDNTILYLIQASIYEDFIGNVQINLFSPEFTSGMDVTTAVDIITDYLPNYFIKYYKQDSCYKYSSGNVDIYTYSCRLNDEGIKYHNDGHFELSNYYNFKIIHFTETNQWKIETGYDAYGDHDLGWIQTNTEPWNINISDFF